MEIKGIREQTMLAEEKESISRVGCERKNLSLRITQCHHSASLVMPIGDPPDRFFYPTLTYDGFL